MTESSALESDVVKSGCATVYASDWANLLLGDSFHPGGLTLTSRLGQLLGLDASSTVLDVACGRGSSAIHLAQTTGCRVIGVALWRPSYWHDLGRSRCRLAISRMLSAWHARRRPRSRPASLA